jgi:predicted deacylase
VEAGSLLGEVVSPYTFGVLEELHAPADGLLFYTARDYPVHPGDWAFGVADTDSATSRWVEGASALAGVA